MEVFRSRRGYLVAVATTALLVVAQVAGQGAECEKECIPISECPELIGLLQAGGISNIRKVQGATCAILGEDPTVCCPSASTTPTPAPPQLGFLPRNCGISQHDKVVGGENAPIDAYPWRALLGYHNGGATKVDWGCGGSIINDRYVLTAAHCVNHDMLEGKSSTLAVVRLGEWDWSKTDDCEGTRCNPPVVDFGIEEVTEHPDFHDIQTLTNDIALIRLNRPIDFFGSAGALAPVCLPPSNFKLGTRLKQSGAIVAGWGLTEEEKPSTVLQHLTLPFVEKSVCVETYGSRLIDAQICMGGEAGKDSCRGDSGGPLVMRGPGRGFKYLQIGLVSFGPSRCGQVGVPGIYTSISHYRKWIEKNIFV